MIGSFRSLLVSMKPMTLYASSTRRWSWTFLIRRIVGSLCAGAMLSAVAACHGALDVSDPSYITDQAVANATGANGRRVIALGYFTYVMNGIRIGALFSDELTYDDRLGSYLIPEYEFDKRTSNNIYTSQFTDNDQPLGALTQYLPYSTLAIDQVRKYTPDSLKGDFLAQLFAFRGFTILQTAETICSGFPINDITPDSRPILGPPVTTDSALGTAIVQLDSSLADVKDSAQFQHLAHVAKARALLDLGQFDAAAAEVASVPTSFEYRPDSGLSPSPFGTYDAGGGQFQSSYVMSDHEGVNGLGFVSEHDPRTPFGYSKQRYYVPAESLFVSLKYLYPNTSIVLASGIEARLIEAEAALHNGDPNWLVTLNTLRATIGMGAMTDPGTTDERVDSLYHERAFWLYLTGHRLGDMRRLVKIYGRDPQTIYPIGAHPMGGTYGNETAIGFNYLFEGQYNSKISSGCISQ